IHSGNEAGANPVMDQAACDRDDSVLVRRPADDFTRRRGARRVLARKKPFLGAGAITLVRTTGPVLEFGAGDQRRRQHPREEDERSATSRRTAHVISLTRGRNRRRSAS